MRGDALAIILKRGGIAEKPIERLRHAHDRNGADYRDGASQAQPRA
jgi:hypothetical protein